VKEVKEKCLNDPENELWSKETEDIPEIREIYRAIKVLNYLDKPDYGFIRDKLKLIYEKSQFIPKFNQACVERFNENMLRPKTEAQQYPQNIMQNTQNITQNPENTTRKPIECYRGNFSTRIPNCPAHYGQEKNYISQNQQQDYLNPFRQAPNYTPPPMNQNYSFGMPPPQQMQQTAIQMPILPKMPLPEYQQPESNLKVSLNQILNLPYQIVMPSTTEINQSISISNLPSLNDLAIRTGISNSVNTILQRSL